MIAPLEELVPAPLEELVPVDGTVLDPPPASIHM